MKKLLSVFMLFACFVGTAQANCQLLACESFSWYEPNGWVKAGVNSNQCWGCGPGSKSCGGGDVVPYIDEYGEIISLYQCSVGISSGFNAFTPGLFCTDSQIQNANTANAKVIYKPVGQKTRKTNVGDIKFFVGGSFCKYIYCLEGYIPDSDNAKNAKCVEDNRQNQCETSGGAWNGTACSCNGASGLKPKADGKSCECINNNYEYNAAAKQCKETEASVQARKDADAAKAAQEKQAACTQSGGAWSNNACACDKNKNLKTENNICVCISDDFERDALNNCVKTDLAQLRERCAAAGNDVAYWEKNSCRCRNVDMIWQHDRCVINPDKAICDNMVDAKWLGGECICSDSDDYEYRNGKCVKTKDAVDREAAAQLTADQNASRGKITTLSTTLKEMQEGFKVTVWRNEDGTFNTTRLASDSIAAVVLGTTGGLVTSHVVKKNQVNKGFDDIQCTVGGQSVAGWGDEFRVGIQ